MIRKMAKIVKCRFPRGKCSCSANVGYSRLSERLDEEEFEEEEEDYFINGADRTEEITFYNENESTQSVVVEKNLCASDLCQLLAMKNRVSKSVHWSIVECWTDLGLERLLEDHEHVLAAYRDMRSFSSHSRFRYKFRKDYRKYEFFFHPQQFFPPNMLDVDSENMNEQNGHTRTNQGHLQYMINEEGKCPVIFSFVWLRDNHKKTWSKHYMVLKEQKLFVSQRVQSIARFFRAAKEKTLDEISEDRRLYQDVRLLCDLRRYHAYAALNAKNQLRAPSEWGVVLRPEAEPISTAGGADQERRRLNGAAGAQLDGGGSGGEGGGGGGTTDKGGGGAEQLRCLACDSERVRSCWVTAMRLAKYGKQLRENYRAFRNKQGDSINPKDYNSYSVPNESVRSRVAMDFTGAVGRIVEDPQEATAIAAAEGYSWKRRWRGGVRCSAATAAPISAVQATGTASAAGPNQRAIDGGVHTTQPWFHLGMTRDKATELIYKYGTVDGVFLVRDSRTHQGSFVITYKSGQKVLHAQVNPILDPLRERPVLSIDNGATKFYDLLQLVEFYQLNAGCLPTRLTHYVTFLLTASEENGASSPSPNGSSSASSAGSAN